MSLRIAIVGAGRMGRQRARAAAMLGARVIAICDPDVDRASQLAADYQAGVLTHSTQICWDSIDAVFVCTPPGSRGVTEIDAIRLGVPLFVEKPAGLCAAQVMPIICALRDKPVVNAVGYMNRYRASVLRARRLIVNNRPLAVMFHWIGRRYQTSWWLKPDQSGGPLNEQCTHFIDLCRFLAGEIAEVQATSLQLSDAPEVDGTVTMTLHFQNGIQGAGLYSCEAAEKQIAFEVFFAGGSVRLTGWDLRLDNESTDEDVFLNEVRAFFGAIRSRDQSAIHSNFETALQTQLVVDALRRAVKSGRSERTEYGEAINGPLSAGFQG